MWVGLRRERREQLLGYYLVEYYLCTRNGGFGTEVCKLSQTEMCSGNWGGLTLAT